MTFPMTKRPWLFIVFILMAAVSCGRKGDEAEYFSIPYSPAVPPGTEILDYSVWDVIAPVTGFHAPWDGLDDMTSFTVNGVDLAPAESPVVNRDGLVVSDGESPVTLYNQFVGTYVANTMVPTGAFFLSGNKFWKSKGMTPIRALRGYFVFNNTMGNNDANDVKFQLTFYDDGMSSSIEHIETDASDMMLPSNSKAYTLDGRQVNYRNGLHPTKGIYIINGKKTVVK